MTLSRAEWPETALVLDSRQPLAALATPAMPFTADDLITAFWQAADDLPADAIAAPHFLGLLAGVCERLDALAPSERLREEARTCREAAATHGRLSAGENVPLAYAWSTTADGCLELTTHNAEAASPGESGTVVGTPGGRVRFDAVEALRAITILETRFPRG